MLRRWFKNDPRMPVRNGWILALLLYIKLQIHRIRVAAPVSFGLEGLVSADAGFLASALVFCRSLKISIPVFHCFPRSAAGGLAEIAMADAGTVESLVDFELSGVWRLIGIKAEQRSHRNDILEVSLTQTMINSYHPWTDFDVFACRLAKQ